MITKGILKTINYNENSCTVRIPLFETASSNNEVILSAVFLTQPGSYNGYSEGDIVFIDFENNSLNNPIVLGKLYLGAVKEKATSKKGGLTVADLSVTSNASLPLDTKLVFNTSDSTAVPVEGGFSTYKSLLDIIKALYKTETSITKATEESLENITKIKVEYLSQPVLESEPTKENPNWSIAVPAYQDGYNIWQKTTCYNKKGQILGEPEIICLSDTTAIPSYWLNCSAKSHSGKQQTTDITLQVMVKIGTNTETFSKEDIIKYKWDSETDWTIGSYTVTIEASNCKDEDLLVEVWRPNGTTSYTAETITFTPKGIPVLDLNPDSVYLAYDSKGISKLNPPEKAITTASVYFNGELVTTIPDNNFTWTVTGGTPTSSEGPTIEITDIDDEVDSATAECNVIHNGVSLKKTFTVTKSRKGGSNYKIDIENDYVTIITGSTGIINNYNWNEHTKHILTLYYGDEIIETKNINIEEPKDDGKLYLKATPNYVTSNTLTAIKDKNQFTNTISAISELSDTGEIKYHLFEGLTLVASAAFKVVRIRQGQPAISYWLKSSSDIHLGTEQNTDLIITAMYKEGADDEDTDKEAILWWWNPSIADAEEGQPLANKWIKASTSSLYSLTFTKDDFKNIIKDNSLKVLATHDDTFEPTATTDLTASEVYELETLSYSPRNTPVLELTNESDALSYSYLGQKIGLDEASTVAKVYLNGTEVHGATYVWKFYTINETGERSEITNLKETDPVTEMWITNIDVNNAEIKITHIPTTKIEAECTASYNWDGQSTTLIKTFTVVRQLQGADGADAIMYDAVATSEVVKYSIASDNSKVISPKTIDIRLNKIEGATTEAQPIYAIYSKNDGRRYSVGTGSLTIMSFGEGGNTTTLDNISTDLVVQLYADGSIKDELMRYYSYNSSTKTHTNDPFDWKELDPKYWPVDTIVIKPLQDGIDGIDGKDGKDGEPIIIQYAYWWSAEYLDSPKQKPDASLEPTNEISWNWSTSTEKTWKISNYTPAADDTHKIIFVSRRSGIETAIKDAPWSNPEVFDVDNSDAYNILTTANGLFGYGQGVYYTYDPAAVVDAPAQITIGTQTNITAGTKINVSQEVIADWIANTNLSNPLHTIENRKKVIKLYIDAEYIKTGYLTVAQDTNNNGKITEDEIIFKAGFDKDGKNPIVKIAGFNATNNNIYSGNIGTENSVVVSTGTKVDSNISIGGSDGGLDGWNFTAGKNFGVRTNSTDNTSELYASRGKIGGFDIAENWLRGGELNHENEIIFSTIPFARKVCNTNRDDWQLILGYNFGVTKDGTIMIKKGTINGDLNAETASLNEVSVLNYTGDNPLKIDGRGGLDIQGFQLSAVEEEIDSSIESVTFKITGGKGDYIGSSSLYSIEITAYDSSNQEIKLAEAVTLNYKLDFGVFSPNNSSSYSRSQTIYFEKKVNFPKNTTKTTVTICAGSHSHTGSWTIKTGESKFSNGSTSVTMSNIKVKKSKSVLQLQASGGFIPDISVTNTDLNYTLGSSTKPWHALYCNEAYATTFYASSDLRLKENIKEFIPKKSILDLPIVEFDFKQNGGHQIGCIAQDLQTICPEIVNADEKGYLRINENKIIYLLLDEVKKLNNKVKKLEDQLNNSERT